MEVDVLKLQAEIDNLKQELSELRHEFRAIKEHSTSHSTSHSALSMNERFQLLRIKNNESVSDQYIISGMGYLDLSPEKAYRSYKDNNQNFIILDVSNKDYNPYKEMYEVTKIPLEDLKQRSHEIMNKSQSIFVISEKGVRSILACKILNELGFYNLSHISGGHKYWPGHRVNDDFDDFDGIDDYLKEA